MISFNPPLNQTTILNIPFHPGLLTFTATVTNGQFDTRSTIQIWSDIPDNNHPPISRGQQDWAARSFKFQTNPSVASLSIPFQDLVHQSRSQFSFTYRILHPDGQIQWLGEYRKNGTLIVNKYDDRLVLFGGWTSNLHRHTFTPKSSVQSPLEVFNLSDTVQWRCWDLSNSFPRLLSLNDGPTHIHSALLIPSQPKAAIIPLSPILLTSQGVQVTIHLNPRSAYITSSSRAGLLSLQTLSPDDLISSLTAALPSLIPIHNPDNHHALFLANPDRAPARLFAIPLSPDSSATTPFTLSLPLSSILSQLQFLSDAPSRFSISKPTRFISTSAHQIQLTIFDFAGAQFFLSPVYDLAKPDGDVRFSILAKHNRIPTHNLLTPPPSPPLSATETETQPSQDNHQSHIPAVLVHHVDDQTSQQIQPPLTSGQSTPNPDSQEQPASGQSTPKPRTAPGSPDPSLSINRPVQRGAIKKIVYFVLRILLFYARILSKIILTVFARLFVSKEEPVATPNVRTVELDEDQPEVKATPLSSAFHTPTPLTPRRQHSGASTPRNDTVNSVSQKTPGVAETLEAVASKIVPKAGGEGNLQDSFEGSYFQEPKPEPNVQNEKVGRNRDGEWEVVQPPGLVFELIPLPSPPVAVEGEATPKVKPLRLTLGGEESLVKGVKFHLDDVEFTNVKVEPLTGTGQDGLWSVEIPRASRDLVTLRIS